MSNSNSNEKTSVEPALSEPQGLSALGPLMIGNSAHLSAQAVRRPGPPGCPLRNCRSVAAISTVHRASLI
jgi:hypothetical protein